MAINFDAPDAYMIGQVCLNGHEITDDITSGHATKFCAQCGEATIIACRHCLAKIRGQFIGEYGSFGMTVAAFCYECGKPHPWTERSLTAAKELADEIDGIEDADREKAKESFVVLASDTPQTAVAIVRVKKLLAKAGPVVGGGIRDVLVSIATEAAKKGLGW